MEDILRVNTPLRQEIRQAVEQWEKDEKIGAVFIKFIHDLNLYSIYANAYDSAITKLEQFKSTKAPFVEFLQTCKEDPKSKGLDLQSYLIMPVQRIPRYQMLLADLEKHMPHDHPDRDATHQALDGMKDVAELVNETIRSRENYEKLLQIQKAFIGEKVPIVAPGRKFLKEGELLKVCRRTNKPFYFHLFNDTLIYSEKIKDTFLFHRALQVTAVDDVHDTEKVQNAFLLKGSSKSFKLIAASAMEKSQWLKAFRTCLETRPLAADDKSQSHAAVWISDREVLECMRCTKAFSVMNRRHHCRNCGDCICDSCSSQRIHIPHLKISTAVRVCDQCYTTIHSDETRDQQDKLLEVQKMFVSKVDILDPDRFLIRQGTLLKVCRRENKKFEFFLFNDLLMYGHSAAGVPGKLALNHIIRPLGVDDLEDTEHIHNAFEVKAKEKSFRVMCPSPQVKLEWLADLGGVVERVQGTGEGGSAVKSSWVPDWEVHRCQICGGEFSMFHRRHHCRQCGRVICGPCSNNKDTAGNRICDDCREESKVNSPRKIACTAGVRVVICGFQNTAYPGSPKGGSAGAPSSLDLEPSMWVPDREARECMNCNKTFTLLTSRHHCRNCGRVVCSACSQKKLLLPFVNEKDPVRVCDQCYFASFSTSTAAAAANASATALSK
eukprot:TRINITY_DN908_c0_g1::TRINITY_DN908_c0_g1_i2::g.16091::m.16091 TRINITY_DN908_c0_g1::TRINITY_DN908_c0_g1_i2::g.16091  ORF type:complete len:664 (-),score=187.68,sp/Q69ZL1/FGD6_MOUSE/31.84/3e-51,sp/Q69ZL1/FGD6_MOUSE/28.76/7e-21,sp/Q69ZL1/FGD6_MOUSE/43.48/4e-10,FYVE/PF01363.16/1.7e-18,FYVE/PF01363.16/4.2e-14,FYVE/PF01363.16/1.1e-20,RhoGEF/PF00621.15/2.3e-35,RhoGEF/PF00621.15/4e+03,PH/PF00169.24/1e-06,PH/PF00169.24/0.0063,FYVE_2/PF02318.11/0.02,FYVE_2/PF02318.11/0.0019,FYVE_2/PF02318.11/0.00011,zf-B_